MNKLKYFIKLILGKHPYIKLDKKLPVERHGTYYGGWNILANSLRDNSVVYSFGVGEDISFDKGIISKYKCKVYAFDPTPRVANWLEHQQLPTEFIFVPIGIAGKDGEVDFFSPANPAYISHSAQPAKVETTKLSLPVKKLATIANTQGHTAIDLLKMDIEGFEYAVIPDIINSGLHIKQLLLEFHHGMYDFTNQQTKHAISQLRNAGYQLFCISDTGREYSFLKQ